MTIHRSLVFVTLSLCCSFASDSIAATPQQDWLATFGNGAGWGVAVDPNGGVLTAGLDFVLENPFVARVDEQGNPSWQSHLVGPAAAYSVAVDASSASYVMGLTQGDFAATNLGGWDAWLAKLDASGNEVWRRQFGTPTDEVNDLSQFLDRQVAVSPDQSVLVIGETYGDFAGTNLGGADGWIIKFDPAGNELWRTQFGTPNDDAVRSLAIDSDGNLYFTGWTFQNVPPVGGAVVPWVLKFDSDGNELWRTTFDAADAGLGRSLALDPAGGVYASIQSFVGSPSGRIARLSVDGDIEWVEGFDYFGSSGIPYSIAADEDGLFIAGIASDVVAWAGYFDLAGQMQWETRIPFEATTNSPGDRGVAAAIDGSGGLYAAGWFSNPSGSARDAFLVRLESVPEPGAAWLLASALAIPLRNATDRSRSQTFS